MVAATSRSQSSAANRACGAQIGEFCVEPGVARSGGAITSKETWLPFGEYRECEARTV